MIAEEVVVPNIQDYVRNFIKTLTGSSAQYQELISDELLDKNNKFFNEKFLNNIKTENLDMKLDTRTTANMYFRNCIVTLTLGGGVEINPYTTLTNPIWRSRILDRDFTYVPVKHEKSEYEQFLWNAAGRNEDRSLSMCSAIGYLLHGYKDKSRPKAVITVDEKISENPDGRSGKSLFGDAISRMKQSVRIDGKNFDFNPRFTFQEINISTEIIDFNDVKENFNFEKLFSVLSDDMSVEYKSMTPIRIKFEESPKIMVSTNYVIKGRGGSHEDRMFELEFSDHYNKNHKPIDEFGHMLFEEWDEEEWNRFDNFMLECLQLYLDEGLIEYQKINLEQRKLIAETSSDFVEFFSTSYSFGIRYNKKDVYRSFSNHIGYEEYDSPYNQRTVTGWVEKYAKIKGYEYRTEESNGKYYFKFIEADQRQD